jgi:hypothetical protein
MTNHRAKWTIKEFNELLVETKNKVEISKIAENHKRTIDAIKYRLIRYGVKMIKEKPTISLEEVQNITNLTRDELLEGFEKINYDYIEIKEDIYMKHINYLYWEIFLLWTSCIIHNFLSH